MAKVDSGVNDAYFSCGIDGVGSHPGVGDAEFSCCIDVLTYIFVFVLLMVVVDHEMLQENTPFWPLSSQIWENNFYCPTYVTLSFLIGHCDLAPKRVRFLSLTSCIKTMFSVK